VVLSGDLRQPRLNALLPASAEAPVRTGRGGGRARTAAVPTAIPHLSVHPALQTELDPADFLASEDVRALVEQLRSTADVVIIDAPPMLVAADATILGSYADGVLLAVTLGHTPTGAVEESAERLRAANAALLGLSVDGAAERRHVTYEATYAYAGADEPGEPGDGDTAATGEHAAAAQDAPASAATPAAAEPAGATATSPGDAAAGTRDDAAADAATGEAAPAGEPSPAAEDAPVAEVPAPHQDALPEDDDDRADRRSGKDRAPVGVETP
jgi:hypothetical protein